MANITSLETHHNGFQVNLEWRKYGKEDTTLAYHHGLPAGTMEVIRISIIDRQCRFGRGKILSNRDILFGADEFPYALATFRKIEKKTRMIQSVSASKEIDECMQRFCKEF